jgi:hypothetical protein
MDTTGLDLHKRESQLCILAADGTMADHDALPDICQSSSAAIVPSCLRNAAMSRAALSIAGDKLLFRPARMGAGERGHTEARIARLRESRLMDRR